MRQHQSEHFEYILKHASNGMAILDATTLRILYINDALQTLLDEKWWHRSLEGTHIEEIIPLEYQPSMLGVCRYVAQTGRRVYHPEIAFEGFLETRGRTYWRVSIERHEAFVQDRNDQDNAEAGIQSDTRKKGAPALLVTVEDVTESVRSRLHLHALHAISSASSGPRSLHLVLDRILQVLQEMFGSKRCAILLFEPMVSRVETQLPYYEEMTQAMESGGEELAEVDGREHRRQPTTARIVAQKGLHESSHLWQAALDAHALPGRVAKEHHTALITDTRTIPEIVLPFIEYHRHAQRPGSVLSVPIFEPSAVSQDNIVLEYSGIDHSDQVIGTIEVYHRRARGFPSEEVEWLEQFAQQAGLAIQSARLFRSIDRWAQFASRQARQKENIMQAIPDGVVICDPRWQIVDTNYAARYLMGWSQDIVDSGLLEAMGKSKAHFKHDVGRIQQIIERFEHYPLSGQVDEFKMTGADGQGYSIRCTYTPIRDTTGDIFAIIIIYHDVTKEVSARERIEAEVIARTIELKQRNAALQQMQAEQEASNERLSLLLEHLPAGVILVSATDMRITLINRQAVQILRNLGVAMEPEDLQEACLRAIGQRCDQLLRPPELYDTSNALVTYEQQPLYHALIDGQSSEAELHTRKAHEPDTYLLVNAAALSAPNGTVSNAVVVYQDITRVKALERSREDFFTTMAHELKTPLANVRAHLSALLAQDLQWSSEEQHEFLQTADEQVDRIVGMINHLLDASRVEAGALRLEIEPVLVPELIEDLQDRLEALINTSKRRLEIDLPDRIPAVRADYELIISVLTNLLSNAFRYAPEGDAVRLKIEAITEAGMKTPGAMRFSVIDRGPGISQEQQAALFTRFSTFAALNRPSSDRPGQPVITHQNRESRWSPGTGLGLYISYGIIEAHGSQLKLHSRVGEGATFTFTLPVFTETHNR
jgi:PAS domain S-box-containing protein